jgi:uncharacterized protein YacL
VRLLVVVCAALAGVAAASALGLPMGASLLAGAAVGAAAVGLEVAGAQRRAPAAAPAATLREGEKLLDTSAIIDGRIADVAATGYLDAPLLVPRFVLRELQGLADGGDSLRRNRGRRGFEILKRLQDLHRVEIVETDVPGVSDVDAKLVELARQRGARVVTTDYNLNRVAELSGVGVLNINDLANALKAVVLPGESLRVQILREGKEPGQGVGFLDDGTMVVVEQGRRLVGQEVTVVVTSALQTSAGRMVFARPRVDGDETGRDA